MSETASKAELMNALRRLVRGLSALFWALPVTLLVCVQGAVSERPLAMGALPPIATTCILLYALRQMRGFQPQERIWQSALERGQLFALINVGLSPFVYWWNRLPQEPFYGQAIALLGVSSVLFLLSLNQILKRLSAMLPDETLRSEVGFFTALNVNLIVTSLALLGGVFLLSRINSLPQTVIAVLDLVLNTRRILMLFLLLLPLAMTMTLLWKTKEAVMASVFDTKA